MSYCGACGTFYNPACPRWPSCRPAPNPHEERNAALIALAAAAVAEVAGMVAQNEERKHRGVPPLYGESSFVLVADALRTEIGRGK